MALDNASSTTSPLELRLASATATPIAELGPQITDSATRSVRGVITVVWPYSLIKKSIGFNLAEPDFRLRRQKGQVRVNFDGACAKAIAAAGLGGGDEIILSLDGAEWLENDAPARIPGTSLEWQIKFSSRALLQVKKELANEPTIIHVDSTSEDPNEDVAPSPALSVQDIPAIEDSPDTRVLDVTPQRPKRRYDLDVNGDEYVSPAFIKRARVSYGSLFEGGLDIFDEEKPNKKGRRKSGFARHSNVWRYKSESRSPSPELESEQDLASEPEPEPEPELHSNSEPKRELDLEPEPRLASHEATERSAHLDSHETELTTPSKPQMMDEGVQTLPMEMVSSPLIASKSVQISYESHVAAGSEFEVAKEAITTTSVTNGSGQQDMPLHHQPSPVVLNDARGGHPSPLLGQAPVRNPFALGVDDITTAHPLPAFPVEHGDAGPIYHGSESASVSQPFVEHALPWGQTSEYPHLPPSSEMEPPSLPHQSAVHYPDLSYGLPPDIDPRLAADHDLPPAHEPAHHQHPHIAAASHHQSEPYLISSDGPSADDAIALEAPGQEEPADGQEAQEEVPVSFEQNIRTLVRDPDQPDGPDELVEDTKEEEGIPPIAGYDDPNVEGPESESEVEAEREEEGGDYDGRNYADVQDDEEGDDAENLGEEEDPKDPDAQTYDEDEEHYEEEEAEAEAEADEEEEEEEERELGPSGADAHEEYEGDGDGDYPLENAEYGEGEYEEEHSEGYDESGGEGEYGEEYDENDGEGEYDEDEEHEPGPMMRPPAQPSAPVFIDLISDSEDDEEAAAPAAVTRQQDSEEEEGEEYEEEEEEEEVEEEADEEDEDEDEGESMREREDMGVQAEGDDEEEVSEEDASDSEEEASVSEEEASESEDDARERAAEMRTDGRVPPDQLTDEESKEGSEEDEGFTQEYESEAADTSPQRRSPAVGGTTPPSPDIAGKIPEGHSEPIPSSPKAVELLPSSPPSPRKETGADTASEPPPPSLPPQPEGSPEVAGAVVSEEVVEVEEIEEEASGADALKSVAEAAFTVTVEEPEAEEEPTQLREPPSADEDMADAPGEVSLEITEVEEAVQDDGSDGDHAMTDAMTDASSSGVPLEDQVDLIKAPHDHEDEDVAMTDSLEATAAVHAMDEQLQAELEKQYQDEVSVLEAEEERLEDAQTNDAGEENDADQLALDITQPIAIDFAVPSKARGDRPHLVLPETPALTQEHVDTLATQQVDEFAAAAAAAANSAHVPKLVLPTPDQSQMRGSSQVSQQSSQTGSEQGMAAADSQTLAAEAGAEVGAEVEAEEAKSTATGEAEGGESVAQTSPPLEAQPTAAASIEAADSAPEDSQQQAAPDGFAITVKSLRSRGHRRNPSTEKTEPAMEDPSTQLARASLAARRSNLAEASPPQTSKATRARTRSIQMSETPEPATAAAAAVATGPQSPLATQSQHSEAGAEEEKSTMTALKLQLNKALRPRLPYLTALKSLRQNANRTVDVIGVATARPPHAQRPKHGPRDFLLALNLTDQTAGPAQVVAVQILRPHIESLPVVREGDAVLLRGFAVTALRGRDFGLRSGDTSSWAVFERDREDGLPQIKGPPVEVSPEEDAQANLLIRWYAALGAKAREKIALANQRMEEAGAASSAPSSQGA